MLKYIELLQDTTTIGVSQRYNVQLLVRMGYKQQLLEGIGYFIF